MESTKAITAWHQLIDCYKRIEKSIASRLHSEYKQSLTRFDVLSQLDQAPEEGLQVGELTRRLLGAGTGVSALLNRMEKENLIVRWLNPNDRRSFQVAITPKGRTLFRRMATDYEMWVASAMADISEQEREVLVGLLGRLKQKSLETDG